jgi:EmrB/QacA subfamily drug resistance transporter
VDPPPTPRRALLITIAIASYLVAFAGTSMIIALPLLGQDLNLEASILGWVMTIFTLGTAMFQIPMGKLSDLIGKRPIFLSGILLFTTTSLVLGFLSHPGWILFFRFIQGTGSALFYATATAILTATVPPAERGKALGVNVAAVYLGLTSAPSLGGMIAQKWGWRVLYFINVPAGIIIIILALLFLRKSPTAEKSNRSYDVIGALFYMIMLATLVIGFAQIKSSYGIILLGIGGISGYLFIKHEQRVKIPILELRLFRSNRFLANSAVTHMFFYMALTNLSMILSLYLQNVRGFDARTAGLVLLIQPLFQAIFSPIAGRMSDRHPARFLVTVGIVILLGIVGILLFIGPKFPIILIFICLGLAGFGFALFASPNTNAIMGSIPKEYYGLGSALDGTTRTVGQTFSLAIVTVLMGIFIGNVPLSPAIIPDLLLSLRTALLISIILCILSIFFSIRRGIKPV